MPTFNVLPAPLRVMVLMPEGLIECMPIQDYLVGVVAAEMPAVFEMEALKAQAVAARTYTMHCASLCKHGKAHVCTDYACCQAWLHETRLRDTWKNSYEHYIRKMHFAIESTQGEYLSSGGQPILAVFHSSSAKATANSIDVWSTSMPYLTSVSSPETEEDVPHYISTVICSPDVFSDTILSAYPVATFLGSEANWIGKTLRDNSGRVASVVLGGVEIKGKELRRLFALRSTAFVLEYTDGHFIFTVTGFGHGVGMSQYGANKMARLGADYRDILAHYYPQTVLVC